MSTTFQVLAALAITALVGAACLGLAIGSDRLFFTASTGALFATAFVYFGSVAQNLRQPPSAPAGRSRSIHDELQALAQANPERPVLKRAYGWLLAVIGATIAIRAIQVFAG
jgi:hypothetical protein